MKRISFINKSAIILLLILFSGVAFSAKKAPKDFTLNFKDVEITDFVNMMGQMVGKNIVYDEQIRGKITISSAKKIPLAQAMDVMISILAVKGYTIVETPNLLRIVPVREAPKGDAAVIVDGEQLKFGDDRSIIYIQAIEKADINEVIKVLSAVKTNATNITVFPPLTSIIFSGPAGEIASLSKLAQSLDKTSNKKDEKGDDAWSYIHVVRLKNSKAEDIAGILSKVPTRNTLNQQKGIATQPGQQNQQNQPISIVASKDTNSLVITCTPDEYSEIRKLIEELDTVREQVLIEAIIMEVSAENDWNFGIDWYLGGTSGSNNFFGNSVLDGAPTSVTKDVMGKSMTFFPPFALGYVFNSSQLGFALLSASANDSTINILSTPQLLTLDNQEAVIYAGEEIPIPSKNTSTTGTAVSYNFDYKSVGIKLKVTPHITDSDKVTLDLYQEVNSILGETSTASATADDYVPPKLGKRDITTKVTVYNGKTIVVGGLISESKTETVSKVPVLGDIPLLGWLFKKKNVERAKKNLLIFITPTVLTDRDKLEEYSKKRLDDHNKIKNK